MLPDAAPQRERYRLEPDGRLGFLGPAADLQLAIAADLERLALEAGAREMVAPGAIHRATLERGGYFAAFGDRALPVPGDPDTRLAPAACYHVYEALAGRRLADGYIGTLASRCGRREERRVSDVARLEHFHMREIVYVGEPAWVAEARSAWMERAMRAARARGLAVRLEPASDLFFGDGERGRRLLQQVKQLKVELRAETVHFGDLAIASFNLHEAFFTSRFDISMAGGMQPVSACVAFGLERWTLACLP